MFSQDCFPYEPESGLCIHQRDSTQFFLLGCKTSSSSNVYLRELLGPTINLPAMPRSCRAIGLPHWSGFSTAPERIAPPGELKASDLLRDRGMTPTYNPPAGEWCYLGADQPKPIVQPVKFRVHDHRERRRGTDMSWMKVSEQDEDARPKTSTAPIQFFRQAPRRVNTSSELTASFETRSMEKRRLTLAEEFASEGLDCTELPSTFDSDDEEECEDIRHARR